MSDLSESVKEKIEEIEESLQSQSFCTRYLLKGAFRSVLFQAFEMQNADKFGKLVDEIVDTIVDYGQYTDREDGENYPTISGWDREKKFATTVQKLIDLVKASAQTG